MTLYNWHFDDLIDFSYSSDDDDDEDDDEAEEEENEEDDDEEEEDDDDTEEEEEGMDDDEDEVDFNMIVTEEVNFIGRQVHVWKFKIIVECILKTEYEILTNPISVNGAYR
jgi:TATA-binding protein-associated factor Taf7